MSLSKLNPVEPPWYGPVCPVVWEGRHREVPPYPDLWLQADLQPPEIDFRLSPNFGHSVAHAGLPGLNIPLAFGRGNLKKFRIFRQGSIL